MKKQQVDHVLRAAGRIAGEKQFIIIGSQSLHGKYPDIADEILTSFEEDLVASKNADRTDRKSTRLNSSHLVISHAVFCLERTNRRAHVHRLCRSAFRRHGDES